MVSNMVTPLLAEVRTSDSLDRLVITPRQDADRHALAVYLRHALPGIKFRPYVGGVWVSARDADALLDMEAATNLLWRPEARLFAENRRSVKRSHQEQRREVARITSGGRRVAEGYLGDVGGLNVLDDHQVVNVAAMSLKGGYGLCLFDEQGAGKTPSLIFTYDVLVERDEVDFMLIVAPKSMVGEWPKDFERFMGDRYRVEVVSGPRSQKSRAIWSRAEVLITNFETTVSMEDELKALLRQHDKRAVLGVDESFFIKNLNAKRTQALRRLREWCGRAYVLCGTPAPNSPQDLVQQFSIVDYGYTFDGVDIPEDRQKALPIVQRAVEERGTFIRHLKRDVLPGLPDKRFQRVLLPMEPIQRTAYKAVLDGLVLDLLHTDDATFQKRLHSFLARRSSMLQICSNPVAVIPGYDEVPAKLKALDALLEQTIAQRGEKVVLWSYYTASIDAIVARYSRYKPVRYDGTVSDIAERRESVRSFQEDGDGPMLFVANPAAAGAGLTLHRARVSVYESMSNQAAHYLQSLDRIHRRGQVRDVEYIVLLCEESVEVEEYNRLIRKEQAAQELLRDEIEQSWSRETMLAEALASLQRLGEGAQGGQ